MPVCVVVTFILKKYQEITSLLNIEILCPDALAVFLKSWVSGFVGIFL
tara:strand:+ start:1529 stop:1672 length:144 start_codon:yes stop_codon:yes gene_type:complete